MRRFFQQDWETLTPLMMRVPAPSMQPSLCKEQVASLASAWQAVSSQLVLVVPETVPMSQMRVSLLGVAVTGAGQEYWKTRWQAWRGGCL